MVFFYRDEEHAHQQAHPGPEKPILFPPTLQALDANEPYLNGRTPSLDMTNLV